MKRLLSMLLLLAFIPLWSACAGIVELPIDISAGCELQKDCLLSNHLYEDPSIRVEWTKVSYKDSGYHSSYYYAIIKLANATQLRTQPAGKDFSRKVVARVEVLANRVHPVIAINGDYYSARPVSYVLRQGVVYQDAVRENSDVLLIDSDGDFHVLLAKDNPASANKTVYNGKKIINAFNFGPALFIDNQLVMNYDAAPSMSEPEGRTQRMIIAQIGKLEYLIFTCGNDVGMSLSEICEVLPTLAPNIMTAYVLDGGNSAQMYFINKKINHTKNNVNVRKVSDIIYFASAWQPDEE